MYEYLLQPLRPPSHAYSNCWPHKAANQRPWTSNSLHRACNLPWYLATNTPHNLAPTVYFPPTKVPSCRCLRTLTARACLVLPSLSAAVRSAVLILRPVLTLISSYFDILCRVISYCNLIVKLISTYALPLPLLPLLLLLLASCFRFGALLH